MELFAFLTEAMHCLLNIQYMLGIHYTSASFIESSIS